MEEIKDPQGSVLESKTPSKINSWLKSFANRFRRNRIEISEQGEIHKTGEPLAPMQVEKTYPKEELGAKKLDNNESIVLNDEASSRKAEESVKEVQSKEPPKNIAYLLASKFKEKGMQPPPDLENQGVAGIIGTNETVVEGFFDAVREQNPDGYIVGVGAGDVFSMLYAFREGITPKGLILADIDPRVVVVGKLLVRSLQDSSSAGGFSQEFFGQTETSFIQKIKDLTEAESDQILKQRLVRIHDEEWRKIFKFIQRDFSEHGALDLFREGMRVDVVTVILNKYPALKSLADNNNLAVAFADFTSPSFVESVKELPEFSDSRNVIYSSNIADHITKRGAEVGNVICMENLRGYENVERPPIFIDSLTSLNYYLRALNWLPDYTMENYHKYYQALTEKPNRSLIFDYDNYETIGLYPLQAWKLVEKYQRLKEDPRYKAEQTRIAVTLHKDVQYSEEEWIPRLAATLDDLNKNWKDDPETLKAEFGTTNPRAYFIRKYGKEVVMMAELYLAIVDVLKVDRNINLTGRPINEVVQAANQE